MKPDGNLQEWKDEQFIPLGNRGAVAVAYDATNLYLAYRVDSGNALHNAGDDPNMLFKTGDSVDLQIGVDAKRPPPAPTPWPATSGCSSAFSAASPSACSTNTACPAPRRRRRRDFASPWRTEYVDKIVRLDPANIGIARTAKGYAVEAVVPLALLGLTPDKAATFKADFGILSDSSGGATQVRTYWANQATGIVSDVPSEIMLTPGLWGDVKFE